MNTRRDFVISVGSLLFIGACKSGKKQSPASCSDVSGISKEEQEKRKKLGYVSVSPIAENKCSVCKLYLPPAKAGECGGCSLFKGPVEPDGYCTYFAPLDE